MKWLIEAGLGFQCFYLDSLAGDLLALLELDLPIEDLLLSLSIGVDVLGLGLRLDILNWRELGDLVELKFFLVLEFDFAKLQVARAVSTFLVLVS